MSSIQKFKTGAVPMKPASEKYEKALFLFTSQLHIQISFGFIRYS